MNHARISKGVPRPLPGFADFFCLRNKRNRRKKNTSLSRRAAFFASIFAPLSADCESSAYLVSDCVGRFWDFARHSFFSVALRLLLASFSSFRTAFAHEVH